MLRCKYGKLWRFFVPEILKWLFIKKKAFRSDIAKQDTTTTTQNPFFEFEGGNCSKASPIKNCSYETLCA
jgi:hypothetical protein